MAMQLCSSICGLRNSQRKEEGHLSTRGNFCVKAILPPKLSEARGRAYFLRQPTPKELQNCTKRESKVCRS
ncbi:unnamed protein product [Acanthoscelides obtectus]|uniref:Uncharacterized protein n=1 Tax=Acanthoscelides obtectus TaxID=200917 RepID=A0A9P0LAG1_ACAOB|nr:unnamed protein product [Acanthoscelides obtectus]CAK1627331.1 hypothetical protein AOBTE_LOCUS4524 [Acanthoscelides obtectus]